MRMVAIMPMEHIKDITSLSYIAPNRYLVISISKASFSFLRISNASNNVFSLIYLHFLIDQTAYAGYWIGGFGLGECMDERPALLNAVTVLLFLS